MCGIAGMIALNGSPPPKVEELSRMLGVMNHRGPDGSGIYLDDVAGLGHDRLAIIDLAGGAQPIHSERQNLWIVYNGEVFNYPELRKDLVSRGHRFYTGTDTEVILHLFEEKGPSCLEELNGQFAFAIWDAEKREIFLARDRMGIIPLHYVIHGDRLCFASEVKAIFALPWIPRAIDPVALDQIFTFWTTLQGHTMFKGVKELPAGHYLQIGGGRRTLKRYWDVPFSGETTSWRGSRPEAAEALLALLRDAVAIRLRADVPVGSYLSGGLDSSGLTALARERIGPRLRTFGIRFEEAPFDEGAFQQIMVSHLGVDHRELPARNSEIGGHFSRALWFTEKPLLRTAPIPLFLLSGAVHESGYKVVLTGEGADEVFGGYDIFREAKIRAFWSRQPGSRLRPLLLQRLYPEIFRDDRLANSLGAFFGRGLEQAGHPFFSHLLRWENTRRIKTFFSRELAGELKGYDGISDLQSRIPAEFPGWDLLSRAQYLEMILFLQGYLLSSQSDRVAMAHSVELRPPYLDHRIVEFMAQIPPHWRISTMEEKSLLKQSLGGLVPAGILDRPKHPYRAPIRSTLRPRNDPLIGEVMSMKDLRELGLFDEEKVALLSSKLERTSQENEVDQMAFTGILSTQMIHKLFIAGYTDLSPSPCLSRPPIFFDRRSGIEESLS